MTPVRGRFALWLFFAFATAVVLTTAIALFSTATRLRAHDLELTETQLQSEAADLEEHVVRELARGPAGEADLAALVTRLGRETGSRTTIIALDGRVIADSRHDPGTMDRHDRRPEVLDAMAFGRGVAERSSDTVKEPLLYYARRVDRDGKPLVIIRVSYPLHGVDSRVRVVTETVLLGTAVALAVGLVIAIVAARRLAHPVEEIAATARAFAAGDFGRRAGSFGGELGEIARALNAMGAELETTLAASENERTRLASVLASMAEGVLAVDADERIFLANDAARELLQLREKVESLNGTPLSSATHLPEVLDLAARARRGEPGTAELELEAADGARRSLRASAVPLVVGPGALRGALVVLADLTALRRLETVRRDFVANVSHELKTPLTSILGYTDTLLAGAIDEKDNARRFVARISENAARLGRLVEDLLALARLERETGALETGPIPLRRAVDEAVGRFADRARAKKVELAAQVGSDLEKANVVGEDEALRQALDNLLDNAVKYVPEGGRVVVAARASESGWIAIEVRDDGPGIPSDALPRVFERFYRVDRARSRALGGTGLGLAIVKHAALAMGGRVSVESAPGKGSTFRLELRSTAA